MNEDAGAAQSLVRQVQAVPPVFDQERARRLLEDLAACAASLEDGAAREGLKRVLGDDAARELLSAAAGNAPYFARTLLRLAPRLYGLLYAPPETAFSDLVERVHRSAREATGLPEMMTALRRAKAEAAVLIALADIGGVWDLFAVTGALTRFADACLQAALHHLLADAVAAGRLKVPNREAPEQGSGIIVVAMGKYGAGELNYSSDIDIVVFYEEGRLDLSPDLDDRSFCVRLTKDLVKLIQEPTGEGYVFRVDLRLRPDAGATPVAISTVAAEQYYESMGQNWERAAWIKARPAAGDLEAGTRFLEGLTPFIWRKYLDYAAIEDIHSIKRQIHSQGGHKAIAVAGHNVKLGLGGIREIEFFVQTQQLIMGGRNKALRNPATCGALDDFVRQGVLAPEVAQELKDSYAFLRKVEHRLQMIEDAQTHTIPTRPEDIARLACFAGYEDVAHFQRDLLAHLTRVNRHYQDLFSHSEPLTGSEGSLVFTGVEDDPETLETLRRMGFKRPEHVAATIRGWHFGRIRATRSKRARELLTKLVPVLLESLSRTGDPDISFARFQDFLSGLPAGVQLFSLFNSHPELLDLITDILGLAPRLGVYMAKNPGVIDALLDVDFLTSLPGKEEMARQLDEGLAGQQDFERLLDQARRWGKDQAFRIGMQILRGQVPAERAGRAYADLADVLITRLAESALADVARVHGVIPGGRYAVIGMGKLGGREMTATSDLDLIVVYDYADPEAVSDGDKPLTGPRYFARFAQRLIAALSAPTAEGVLYDVDMKLRPSGRAGPIATHFEAFRRYYRDKAWTWEFMALTRARVVAASEGLAPLVTEAIRAVLQTPRALETLARDVRDMRARILREKSPYGPWDLKYVRGGLIDQDFICQFLQLAHGAVHPHILDQNTRSSLERAVKAGLVPQDLGPELLAAVDLTQSLIQVVRLAVEGDFVPREAAGSLKDLLASSGGCADFAALENRLARGEARVVDTFDAVIGRLGDQG